MHTCKSKSVFIVILQFNNEKQIIYNAFQELNEKLFNKDIIETDNAKKSMKKKFPNKPDMNK